MSEEARYAEFPPCPFEDFLNHMNNSESEKWTWAFIEMCSRFGVFHSSPEGVVLARPVNSEIPEEDLMAFNDLDPDHELASTGLTGKHDTWHVLYASGDPSSFFDLCPYELKFISWHRNKGTKNLKRTNFKRLKQRFHGKHRTKSRT